MFWVGFVWCLPLTLAGLVAGLWFRATDWKFRNGIFVIGVPRLHSNYVGMALGCCVLLTPRATPVTILHESRHVFDCLILGPIMPLAYGLASAVAVIMGGDAYRDNWFEKRARAFAGQK